MNSRRLAVDIIRETLEEGGQSHRLLQQCFRNHPELDGRERGFITAMVHGTIGRVLTLDHYLAQISRTPPEKMKPFVRNLLRMSLYQMLYMDRVPASAVCNEAVKILRAKMGDGLSGFVNGVLRSAARKEDWHGPSVPVELSLLAELYESLKALYGEEESRQIGEQFLAPSPLWGRVNESRGAVDEVIQSLAQEGFTAQPSPLLPGALRLERSEKALPLESLSVIREGLLQLQDISAQLAVKAADPRPGFRVLDLCAAPGGKSLQAADLMRNQGEILACDISKAKCSLIRENIARSGFDIIRTQTADAALFDPAKEGAFDLVIADLPCSGLGVAGRKPEIKYRAGQESIRALAALQRQMLQQAARYAKPGGKLLFSTCTITKEENADNADYIEQELGLKPCPLALPLKEMGLPGGTARLQLLPGDFQGDGFYIAVFERRT